jgi:hypothetical protein
MPPTWQVYPAYAGLHMLLDCDIGDGGDGWQVSFTILCQGVVPDLLFSHG